MTIIHPMRLTASRPASGFTLVEIMIVVAIIGVLAAISIPNFAKARSNAQVKVCVGNLSQIEAAKQQWGLEAGRGNGDLPATSDLIGATNYIKKTPVCPAGGTYSFNPIGSNATCTVTGHSY